MIASTWEAHCAEYKPSAYSAQVDRGRVNLTTEADELAQVLLDAHHRLNTPCGTIEGYLLHLGRYEQPCRECRTAWRSPEREGEAA